MVGAPRTLSDLARLDANPIVACRSCVWHVEYDRARLISQRIAAGLSTDWHSFCAEARCEHCGGETRVTMRMFVGDRALRSGDLRTSLSFKALCVLSEAQEAAKRGRVPPSAGLRLALAYLYAVGQRAGEWFDREPYVEFWQQATQRENASDGPASARLGKLQTCANAIARAAGMEMTPNLMDRLRTATRRVDSAAGGDAPTADVQSLPNVSEPG